MNNNPEQSHVLGTVIVSNTLSENDYSNIFLQEKKNIDIITDIDVFREHFEKAPDYELVLDVDMSGMDKEMMDQMMIDMGIEMHDIHGIEWEDNMLEMNRIHTSENTRWIIRDEKTGKENMDVMIDASVGDVLKIRIKNDPDSIHPMQHPIHIHGQRFLVLPVHDEDEDNDELEETNQHYPEDEQEEHDEENHYVYPIHADNLVWKDTALIPVGETVDLLVHVTNPGMWMMHCHIAEHLESGMMTMFMVREE